MNYLQSSPASQKKPSRSPRASRVLLENETIKKLSFDLSETTPILEFHGLRSPVKSRYNMHFGLEFGLIISGRMRRYYQNYWRNIGPGQVWFCGMWEPHGMKVLQAPCQYMIFIIWPPMLANLRLEEAPNTAWLTPFTLPPNQRPQIVPRMKNRILKVQKHLKEMLATPSAGQPLWLKLLFLEMMVILYEQGSFRQTSTNAPPPDFFLRLNQALQNIFESRALITTAQAARSCGMTRETFSNLFARWMSIRFSEFCLRYRVNTAAHHVAHTDEPIKSIAKHWGFIDSSHFHHCFQKYYHCTPGEYRQHQSRHSKK